jgi:hypothetical protein
VGDPCMPHIAPETVSRAVGRLMAEAEA